MPILKKENIWLFAFIFANATGSFLILGLFVSPPHISMAITITWSILLRWIHNTNYLIHVTCFEAAFLSVLQPLILSEYQIWILTSIEVVNGVLRVSSMSSPSKYLVGLFHGLWTFGIFLSDGGILVDEFDKSLTYCMVAIIMAPIYVVNSFAYMWLHSTMLRTWPRVNTMAAGLRCVRSPF